jgi:hypothetical protein
MLWSNVADALSIGAPTESRSYAIWLAQVKRFSVKASLERRLFGSHMKIATGSSWPIGAGRISNRSAWRQANRYFRFGWSISTVGTCPEPAHMPASTGTLFTLFQNPHLYPKLYPSTLGSCDSRLFYCSHAHSMFKHETSNVLVTQIGTAKQLLESERHETARISHWIVHPDFKARGARAATRRGKVHAGNARHRPSQPKTRIQLGPRYDGASL